MGALLGLLQLLQLVLGDSTAALLLQLFVFGQQLLLEVFILSLRLLGILRGACCCATACARRVCAIAGDDV